MYVELTFNKIIQKKLEAGSNFEPWHLRMTHVKKINVATSQINWVDRCAHIQVQIEQIQIK